MFSKSNAPSNIDRKTTSAKAIVAAIGTTITALATANAAVQVAVEDNEIGIGDVTSIMGAVTVMVLTIYGVWRVPNKDIPLPNEYKPGAKM